MYLEVLTSVVRVKSRIYKLFINFLLEKFSSHTEGLFFYEEMFLVPLTGPY